MKKKRILMNKPVDLGLSILEISKIVMYEFWHDCVKPKYGEKAKYTQVCSLHKHRRRLPRHCKKCRNKTEYFKLQIIHTIT